MLRNSVPFLCEKVSGNFFLNHFFCILNLFKHVLALFVEKSAILSIKLTFIKILIVRNKNAKWRLAFLK